MRAKLKIIAFTSIVMSLTGFESHAQEQLSIRNRNKCEIKTDFNTSLDWISYDDRPVEVRMSANFPNGTISEKIIKIAPAYVHAIEGYEIINYKFDRSIPTYKLMPKMTGFERGPGTSNPNGAKEIRISLAYPSGLPMTLFKEKIDEFFISKNCDELNQQYRLAQNIVRITLVNKYYQNTHYLKEGNANRKMQTIKTYNDRFMYHGSEHGFEFNLFSKSDDDYIDAINCSYSFPLKTKVVPYCTAYFRSKDNWAFSVQLPDIRYIGYDQFINRIQWLKSHLCSEFSICGDEQ